MNLSELKKSDRILFECRSGSFAYGTNTEKSDIDIKGIFFQSKDELINLESPPVQINDERNDTVYYSLRRYIELASSANPNILELLFMPDDCIFKTSELFDKLLTYRNEFITVKCLETHRAYALAQIKKAKGRNKWINNPQPRQQPSLENFAYFISAENKQETPGRPQKLLKYGLDLKRLKASSVEHCPGLYRIYKSSNSSPLFTENQICCSSIPFDDEMKNFSGFIFVNEDAYKRALTDHKNYWEWVNNRNPDRWKMQELGELDFDAKNMQHTIRLLITARHIVEHGQLTVRFEGDDLEYLKNIRHGKYSYSELIEASKEIDAEIEVKLKSNSLRPEMSAQRAGEIFLDLMNTH